MGKAGSGEMIYIYCLTRSHEDQPLNLAVKGIGRRDDEVYSISFLDLAFVVSDSPSEEYETNRENTIRHEVICEEVMKKGLAVVPVRFGSVATPADKSTAGEKVVKLLRRRYGELREVLREMEGKDELGLKVFWKKQRLFQDILDENQDIRLFRDRIASSGVATHYQMIEMGTMVHNAMEAKRDVDARRLALALSPLAERYETNKVLMDRMVLNASFLVPKPRVEAFDRKVDELDENYGERIKLNYVGPLPPFDFVELVINWEEEEEEFEIVRKGKKVAEMAGEFGEKIPHTIEGVA